MSTTKQLVTRANRTAKRLRAEGKSEQANRFLGRADVVISREAARRGEPLSLYVTERPDGRHMLTTWTGNVVSPLEHTGIAYGFHGVRLNCYRAVIQGRTYIGRGHGPGVYINMRPSKKTSL